MFLFLKRKWPYSDTNALLEAENLGIRSFFRDLSFERDLGPWGEARDPKIEVSRPKNQNIFNHMLGLADLESLKAKMCRGGAPSWPSNLQQILIKSVMERYLFMTLLKPSVYGLVKVAKKLYRREK